MTQRKVNMNDSAQSILHSNGIFVGCVADASTHGKREPALPPSCRLDGMLTAKWKKRTPVPFLRFLARMGFLLLLFANPAGNAVAGINDLVAGATGSRTEFDPSAVNLNTFSTYFSYRTPPLPSFTMNGIDDVLIGAIWKGAAPEGEYREIRIAIDSNNDGVLNPIDWSDPTHPWNRPDNGTPENEADDPASWSYVYPQDYPDASLRGTTLAMTWDDECYCVQGFPEESFDWTWYTNRYDWSNSWWDEPGKLVTFTWDGRDPELWGILPNGDYLVEIAVDENDDWVFGRDEARQRMIVAIRTAGFRGRVVDESGRAIQGAKVEAYSQAAWSQAFTDDQGRFTLYGMQAGGVYYVTIASTGYTSVELQDVDIPEGTLLKDLGAITLKQAIAITGTLKLDLDGDGVTDEAADVFQSYINQWGWEETELSVYLDGWNTIGPGYGNGEAVFQVGAASASFAVSIPKTDNAVYQLTVHAEGFASQPVEVQVGPTGGNAGTIVLTKASILSGAVKLAVPVRQWTGIDVMAVNTADADNKYWGWGDIDPYYVEAHCTDGVSTDYDACIAAGGQWKDEYYAEEPLPKDSGTFRFDGLPAGTYNLEIRVNGFKVKQVANVEIVHGSDKDMGVIDIERGNVISGTLAIQGDTTGLRFNEYDSGTGDIAIWIDAWSPETYAYSGVDALVPRGENRRVNYEIGGLDNGRYELSAWLGEGYELVDENGNAPVFVDLQSPTAVRNLILKPFEGRITGTIQRSGVMDLDLSRVAVEVKRPWDWLPPRIATLANGGLKTDGSFEISGLGTGDYVVKAGLYLNLDNYDGTGFLLADPSTGIKTQRVFVENNRDAPTHLEITLERGYSVSGTIRLSDADPPWHDFGDGAGGEPNGLRDVTSNEYNEQISIADDLAGGYVIAIPLDMTFMGGDDGSVDPHLGIIRDNGDGTASYRVNGLSPGAYRIKPPEHSPRIVHAAAGDSGTVTTVDDGANRHHWTAESTMIVINEKSLAERDFTLANGYTVSGTLTLPEAQTLTDLEIDPWTWVGQLSLETPDYAYTGFWRDLYKRDFNNSTRFDFKFEHVANGEYMLFFWTDRYVPASAVIAINNAGVSINLNVEKGVDLTGKLVDAATGKAVTSKDGVRVICWSEPYADGSYRETNNGVWSSSYIEDDTDLRSGETGTARPNLTPGKFHLTSVPAGHQYIIIVEAENGKKTMGARNYISRIIAGIQVPEDAAGEINVGTIELTEGVVIAGRLTDAGGEPVAGVDVVAMPSDFHDGASESMGASDANGYYTIYGIDPNVGYYDLIAARRPWLFDDWGRQVEWGEDRRYNIKPADMDEQTGRTRNADFTLARATASLTGMVTIPENSEFMIPFVSDDAEGFPATYILLQKKGVVYRDMLEGIEGLTVPRPGDENIAPYRIENIAPGNYKIIFMNYGLPRAVIDNVTIGEGEEKTVNVAWDNDFYRLHGGLSLADGGFPSETDISGVVCMNTVDRSLVFGRLTREVNGTYSAYEVAGLAASDTYQLIFYKDSEADESSEVFAVGEPFITGAADKTYDVTIDRDEKPVLIFRAVRDPEDQNKIHIGVFSTCYLTDNRIEITETEPTEETTTGAIYLKTGNGTLADVEFGADKRRMFTTYTSAAADSTIEIVVCVHYGEDAVKVANIVFSADAATINSKLITIYTSEQAALGNGDSTRISIPSGAMETLDSGNVVVTIEKSTQPERHDRKSPKASTPALPSGVSLVSDLYSITAADAASSVEPTYRGTMTVQVEYNPDLVTDTSLLNIYHLVDGVWRKETAGREVDTMNHTVAAEVDSLSTFVVGHGVDASSASGVADVGEGSKSDCFIGSAAEPNPAVWFYALVVFILFLVLHRRNFNRFRKHFGE